MIPALGRQRQADLCEFETSLVYRASSMTGSKATQRNSVSKIQKEREKERKKERKKERERKGKKERK